MAPFVFEGYGDRQVFETYVQECLLPVLTEGDVVILDNAAFHKSQRTKELITAKGSKLIFLPPYSPDLNPIEHWWFPIKHTIRQLLGEGCSLTEATDRIFHKYV